MGAPGFWDDAERAAATSAEHAKASRRLETFAALQADVDDLDGLVELAGVEVSPVVADAEAVEIDEDDLQVDTYRASGAGGQHVNKTDSAVRITHGPTGIVVQCQNERSQSSNRATAMSMLRAKLLAQRERERAEEIAREKGEAQDVNFGSQIRSYVMHPYSMVKDHRTGQEVGDVERVLQGDLDPFVRSSLLAAAPSRG